MFLYSLIISMIFSTLSANDYNCPLTCSPDPLEQLYPDQNMCLLLAEIPASLRNLSYGIYPNCNVYDTNRFSYNKRFNWFPNAIFTPSTVGEVQYVLRQMIEKKLSFFVRSGGHCYEQVHPRGYIIDLRNLNTIIPDTSTKTVYIGAGCKLGNVISTLGAINYAIPTGTCPSVGVSGLALGGGVGLLIRNYGLTCDSIVSMAVITADNQLIEVSENSYPDLFWALRGAGANSFGIVVGYTFKMYYIPTVSFLQLRWSWDPKKYSDIYNTWQKWVMTLPRTISAEIVLKYNNGKVQLGVNALKVGSAPFTEWECAFKKYNPTTTSLYKGNYTGAAALFASNYARPFSKTKSKFLMKPLGKKAVNIMIDFMGILLKGQCNYEAFFSIGGGIPGAITETNTAYFPRHAFGWMFDFIYWAKESQQKAALHLINQVYKDLEPYTSPYSYANLIDYDLGSCYLKAYWGTHVPRLIKIKSQYDPKNIFKWRQGIPVLKTPKSLLKKYIKSMIKTN